MSSKEMHSAIHNLLELRLVFNYYTWIFFFFLDAHLRGMGIEKDPEVVTFEQNLEEWIPLVGWCSDYST